MNVIPIDKSQSYIEKHIEIEFSEKDIKQKERRFINAGGRCGREGKKFLKGIDYIAIINGPYAGDIIKTDLSEFEVSFKSEVRKGVAFYKRVFNPINGKFFFTCEKIYWRS